MPFLTPTSGDSVGFDIFPSPLLQGMWCYSLLRRFSDTIAHQNISFVTVLFSFSYGQLQLS